MTNSTLLRAATPNNNTYTLPSSVTINSYASLRKLTTPITPLTPLTPAHSLPHAPATVSLTPCSRESGSREACDASRDSGSRDTCQSSSSLSRSEVIVDPSAAELQERFRQMEVREGEPVVALEVLCSIVASCNGRLMGNDSFTLEVLRDRVVR